MRKKMETICILLFSVNIIFANGFSGEIVAFSDTNQCNATEYFNAHLFKCVACSISKNLHPTTDGLSCTCNSQSKIISTDINGFPECESCPIGEVATYDRRDCIKCAKVTVSNNVTSCERCPADKLTLERHTNGTLRFSQECLQCGNNTAPSANGGHCMPCTFNLIYTGGGKCTCPVKTHEYLDGVCIPRGSRLGDWPDDRRTFLIEYDNGEKIESNFLKNHLRSSVYLCFNKNRTACQILANMCTMVMFRDNYKGSPCRMFQNSKHIPTLESNTLPWIYYGEGDAISVLSRKKIPIKFSLDPGSKKGRLNFTVVKFTPFGTFEGISTSPGSFLHLCPDSWLALDSGLRVGVRYRSSCRLPAQQLVASTNTRFFDLYLQYFDGAESLLYAVPVLVLNVKSGNNHNNQGGDISQWQLTRRFFLIDKLSGVGVSSNERSNPEEDVGVIQYLKSCKIRIKVQGREEEGKIYPPLLIVEYGFLTEEELHQNINLDVDFSVDYEMESSMPHAIEVSMGVMCALAVVWSGIQSWSHSRRSGRVAIDLLTIWHLLVFACGNLANAFFFVVVCASIHLFTFYKGQSIVQVLLPSKDHEHLLRSYIIAAFSLKIVEVVHLIWNQITIDIFFIDWERPRARSAPLKPRGNLTSTSPDTGEQPVSIWRTYFVANEWNEIQTKRRVSILVQLFVTVFLLKVVGIEHWATSDPELHSSVPNYMEKTPPSVVCRFAVGVLVYIFVYLLQWTFMVAMYERYIKNGIQEFVDICSLANISVFILALENYGYYIHGRSPHGFADTDMPTILSQLQREEDDLCGHRGLLPGTDQQTFQMSVPYQLRSYYRQVMAPITTIMQSNKRISFGGSGGLRAKMASGMMERSLQAYNSMNKFLTAFLDHALKDLDYEVREKLFVESLLDIDFTETSERGVFYIDDGHSFDKVLFYGNEMTLAVFDIMLFSFVEILFQDFLLAVIVTAFVAKILVVIRQFGGKKNLAKKTLIDERFLI